MEPPAAQFDKNIYEHIKNVRRDKKRYMMTDLKVLGSGVSGTTFTAYLKPKSEFPKQLVLKEIRRDKYSINEFEALKFLREQMISGELPGYYIFMYGCFSDGEYKYLILEKADYNLDQFMVDYDLSTEQYLRIFYHIAQAVDALEKKEFNHGDLWSENVMFVWNDDSERSENEREFTIKLIDFDAAFMTDSQINHPSQGGADTCRKRFVIGYDMNRFFDSLVYSYESYLKKRKRYQRIKDRQKRRGDDSEDPVAEVDRVNIVYPPEIVEFMYSLKPIGPNSFKDRPDMSGENVMQQILDFAEALDIELF